ncbi:MAG: hypothetical protein NZU63_07705 [Gemmataceae bacterium]|nr:hypothetical protein [Gemmataceae bacterium]MDW8244367.1 hypothetical protein [Thermogemmata sp.]
MKRILSLLVLAFSVALFSGCGESKPTGAPKPATGGTSGTTQPAGGEKK